MSLTAAVVLPVPESIVSAYTPISGWYVDDVIMPVGIMFGGVPLIVSQEDRSDLHKLYPGKICRGFHSVTEVDKLKGIAPGSRLLQITINGGSLVQQSIAIEPDAIVSANRSRAARLSNRAFALAHLICSRCGASLAGRAATALCPTCKALLIQDTQAVSAVEVGSYVIPKTINTSFCGYDDNERDLVKSVEATGGRVLDFGAGLRPETNENIVSLEIADMPSIDLGSLPRSFSGSLNLAAPSSPQSLMCAQYTGSLATSTV